MRDDLIETLRDCANELGELLPRNHAYRKIVDKANRLLHRHDQSSTEQRAADALRDLMDALPAGTQTSMTVFKRVALYVLHAAADADLASRGSMPTAGRGRVLRSVSHRKPFSCRQKLEPLHRGKAKRRPPRHRRGLSRPAQPVSTSLLSRPPGRRSTAARTGNPSPADKTGTFDLERLYIRTTKRSTDEQALHWMCGQYSNMLQRLKSDLGDWQSVGLIIGQIISEPPTQGHGKR